MSNQMNKNGKPLKLDHEIIEKNYKLIYKQVSCKFSVSWII